MKPAHVIFTLVLAIVLIIIMVRTCQDDYDFEHTKKEKQETNEYAERESPFIHLGYDIDIPTISEDNTSWPDSIFSLVNSAPYLSQMDKDVIIELNKCRTNPSRYADEALIPFLNKISADRLYVNSEGLNIKMEEGRSAVKEAISALKSQSSRPMLRPKQYLCLATNDHVNDQGPNGYVGHGGSDGSSPISRVQRHNPRCRGVGENIDYGSNTASEIIVSLIVDDGVPDRGHRDNIFHNYKYVGTSFGPHKAYRYMCVMDFE